MQPSLRGMADSEQDQSGGPSSAASPTTQAFRHLAGSVAGALRTRWGAFALAITSMLVIAAGVTIDGRMTTLPSYVATSCANGVCAEEPNPAIQLWVGLLVVALGIGLLVAAWTVDHRPGEQSRKGWDALRTWGDPLLWLAVIPIVAVPMGVAIAAGAIREPTCQILVAPFVGPVGADCPASALLPSVLIPGLLNLVPLRWLWTSDPRTRIAAIAASVLGFTCLTASLWALLAQGSVVRINFSFFGPPYYPPGGGPFLGFQVNAWLMTLIALLVIAKLPVAEASRSAE